jgi:N-methylhydantoinase B
MVSVSAGGGGYGPPTMRDAERVAHDVAEGWVSSTRAANTYGVVLDDDGKVDVQATSVKRSQMREEAW